MVVFYYCELNPYVNHQIQWTSIVLFPLITFVYTFSGATGLFLVTAGLGMQGIDTEFRWCLFSTHSGAETGQELKKMDLYG